MPTGLLKAKNGIVTGKPVDLAHPLNRGLLGWWLCLPGAWGRSGYWRDLMHENHGVLTAMDPGTDWGSPDGRVGGYGRLNFDATDDNVVMPTVLDATGDFTCAFWFRATSISSTRVVIYLSSSATDYFVAGTVASRLLVSAANANAASLMNNANLSSNVWYHAVVTKVSGDISDIYLNAVNLGTAATNRLGGTTSKAAFGATWTTGSAGTFWGGDLDDVRCYNRILPANEVWRLYVESRLGYPSLLRRQRRTWFPGTAAVVYSDPTYRDSTLLTAASDTSAVVVKPTGTADDDILLVGLYIESTATVTAPSGWALITSTATTIGGDAKLYVYWKRASSEGSDWTWSWTGAATREAVCVAVPGCVDSGDPWDAYDDNADADSDDSVTPGVQVTTTHANNLLVWFGAAKGTGAWTPPTDFDEREDGSGHISLATKTQASIGLSGSLTGSYSGSASAAQAVLVSLTDGEGGRTTRNSRSHQLGTWAGVNFRVARGFSD